MSVHMELEGHFVLSLLPHPKMSYLIILIYPAHQKVSGPDSCPYCQVSRERLAVTMNLQESRERERIWREKGERERRIEFRGKEIIIQNRITPILQYMALYRPFHGI